jgi:hypothetical protein
MSIFSWLPSKWTPVSKSKTLPEQLSPKHLLDRFV